jgi:hypothetical protein
MDGALPLLLEGAPLALPGGAVDDDGEGGGGGVVGLETGQPLSSMTPTRSSSKVSAKPDNNKKR